MLESDFIDKLFDAIEKNNVALLEELRQNYPDLFQQHINVQKIERDEPPKRENAKSDLDYLTLKFAYENRVARKTPQTDIALYQREGQTPLTYAAFHNWENAVTYLLGLSQVNVNAANILGKTALMCAIQNGHENIVKILLQNRNINVNARDNYGITALHYAIVYEDIVEILLAVPGIKINVNTPGADTALQMGLLRGFPTAILIKDKIEQLTVKAFNAVRKNDLATIKSVTDQIWIDNICDAEGNTLVDIACSSNCPEIIMLLLQNAEKPDELLARFPFEALNPSSEIFEYFINLAYGIDSSLSAVSKKSGEPEDTPKYCAHCAQVGCTERCGGCKEVYYCSTECQKADWKVHKTQCANIL